MFQLGDSAIPLESVRIWVLHSRLTLNWALASEHEWAGVTSLAVGSSGTSRACRICFAGLLSPGLYACRGCRWAGPRRPPCSCSAWSRSWRRSGRASWDSRKRPRSAQNAVIPRSVNQLAATRKIVRIYENDEPKNSLKFLMRRARSLLSLCACLPYGRRSALREEASPSRTDCMQRLLDGFWRGPRAAPGGGSLGRCS